MVKCQMARMELQSCHHCRHLLYFSVCVCVRRPLEFYDLVSFSFSCFICLVFCASVVIFVFPFFFFFFFFASPSRRGSCMTLSFSLFPSPSCALHSIHPRLVGHQSHSHSHGLI